VVASPPSFDPRRRIRELLSIPDRDRTDAEWDELNELEIQTAPGNRSSGQPFSHPGHPAKSAGTGFPPNKNRNKGKGLRKPGGGGSGTGGGGGGGRPPMQGARPNNNNSKPRPA